jgi:ATP-dependent DNA ligase
MLFRHEEISLVFVAFDVLTVEGAGVRPLPYRERRPDPRRTPSGQAAVASPEAFARASEAAANNAAPSSHEGLVAKRPDEPYLCDERGWLRVKNRDY